jgi:hypothetical protein
MLNLGSPQECCRVFYEQPEIRNRLAGSTSTLPLTFATTDNSVLEIDAFDGALVAWKVDDVGLGSVCEPMANLRAEGLIVGEGHDPVSSLNRRILIQFI